MKSMKIVVLAGGISSEREVSLVSGSGVCRALRENGHRAVLIDLFLGLESLPKNLEMLFDMPDGNCPSVKIAAKAPDLDAVRRQRRDSGPSHIGPHVLEICQAADLVFLGLHGADGEDGRIQATLELLGIPYTGSGPLASALAMNKIAAKRMMSAEGIPTPKWKVLNYNIDDVERLTKELPVPCVLKTPNGGSSLGVYLPENRQELQTALTNLLQFGTSILLEERIRGRELTVAVLGDRALPAVETEPVGKEFDYEAKYSGTTLETCPADIPPEIARAAGDLALKVHRCLGLEVYSRTDMMLDPLGTLWCLEANSLPGMTPTSFVPQEAAVIGMNYNELCEEIVRLSCALNRRENEGMEKQLCSQ